MGVEKAFNKPSTQTYTKFSRTEGGFLTLNKINCESSIVEVWVVGSGGISHFSDSRRGERDPWDSQPFLLLRLQEGRGRPLRLSIPMSNSFLERTLYTCKLTVLKAVTNLRENKCTATLYDKYVTISTWTYSTH